MSEKIGLSSFFSDRADDTLSPDSLGSILRDLSPHQRRILNDLAHAPDRSDRDDFIEPSSFEPLRELGLVEQGPSGFLLPRDVLFHPRGPGVRRDQLVGVWRHLPESARHRWLRSLNRPEQDGLASVGSEIFDYELNSAERSVLDELLNGSRWTVPPSGGPFPGSVKELYEWAGEASGVLARLVLRGVLLPGWEHETLSGLVLAHRYQPRLSSEMDEDSLDSPVDTDGWQRTPFEVHQQLKILTLLADTLPFRVTEKSYPHRFDVKESARKTGWRQQHLQVLVRLALEQDLLTPGDDRFYLTSKVESLGAEMGVHALQRTALLLEDLTGVTSLQRAMPDFSCGRLFRRALVSLKTLSPESVSLEHAVESLRGTGEAWSYLAAQPQPLINVPSRLSACTRRSIRILFDLGLVDGMVEEDELQRVRINERGSSVLDHALETQPERSGELPMILQADGSLMLPLEAPFEWFRRVNPFCLPVKADRMMSYQVDRESLVSALNKGWDARAFYRFLQQQAETIPDPLEELFEEVLGAAQAVDVEEVHHLLRFESAAVASRAERALRNYQPERITDTDLLLHNRTTEETIRRNLSQGGIRLKQNGQSLEMSPIRPVEGETGGPESE